MDHIFEVKREELLQRIDSLYDELQNLRKMIMSDEALKPIALYSIPLRNNHSLGNETPVEVVGDDYRQKLADAMTTIYLVPGQSSRETIRLPGAIQCSDSLIAEATRLNGLKLEINGLIEEIPSRQRRHIYRLRKSLQAIQMRRVFEIAPERTRSIKFFWHSSPGVTRIRVHEVRNHILNNLRELLNDPSLALNNLPEALEDSIEYGMVRDLNMLHQYDGREVMAKVKLVQPHSRFRLSYTDPFDKFCEFQAPCSLPILFSESAPPPVVKGTLANCDNETTFRSDVGSRLMDEPILSGMGIYRYHEKFRKLSDEPTTKKKIKRKTALPAEEK